MERQTLGETAAERDPRRRAAMLAGVIGLVVGLVIGAAAGGSGTKTVTDARDVVRTETTTVPVERVKTVTKVRRVVRVHTKTVTVQAQAAPVDSGGGSGGSDSGSGSDGSQYAGMTCAEIGHSFTVTPGSDPEHDADNDGIACEAYQ
jgi:hypothetical protein